LPEVKEPGLVHPKELICYQQNPDEYPIPSSHLEMFPKVRLADYVGANNFLKAAAGWLDVGVHEISNVNPVGRVYQLILGALSCIIAKTLLESVYGVVNGLRSGGSY
jgi:hypothetical protein